MYDEIYSLNFFYSFLLSSLFLIINLIFSFTVSFKNQKSKKINLGQYQPILIFFLIFCFYSIILNVSILIDFKILIYFFVSILSFKIFYIIKNFQLLLIEFNFNFFFRSKIIFIFFFLFYLIAILPMSDADSIAIFQNLSSVIYTQGLEKLDLAKDLEFSVFSNTETLLILSSIMKSDNFGAQLNLISLIFLISLSYKDNKNFLLLIFSSPLIIYFISAQKLQLFFGVLYLLLFILIHKKIIQKKFEIFLVIILLTFYSSGKITYILFSIPLFIYLIKNNIKLYKEIILYSLISCVIIYGPLLLIKQIYFNNILAPFFDNFLGLNKEIFNAFAFSLRSTEGWLSDPSNINLYLRPFLAFEISKISSSLGLIFLFMLFNYKLQKELYFLPLTIVVLILLTGQILPRYYFEAFLLLAFFFSYKSKFIKFIIYTQLFVVILFTSIYIYISYFELSIFKGKINYQNKFSYSFYDSQQIKKDLLDGNILDFSLDRDSIYFDDNVYSLRYLNILNNYNNDSNENIIKFIKANSIKYLVINNYDQIPNCIETKEIKETSRKKSVRNFLKKIKKNKYKILEIKDNKCI